MRVEKAKITSAKMAHLMPRISIFEAAILVSFISACAVHAQGVDGVMAGAGAVASQAGAAAGVSHSISSAQAGVSQGPNNVGVGVSHGNIGAGVGVSAQHGPPSNSNAQQNGNNPSIPVKPGPEPGAGTMPKPKRGITSPQPGVPVAKARKFLAAHNKVRASLNEPPLQWDNGLAHYARRWATKRSADCKMLHSYGQYGENIFWGEKDVWTPAQVVESWVSECKYYDEAKNVCAAGQMCGHYTQVVWLDSTKLGCAMVTCLNGGMFAVCNYDPPGNYVNESPFKHFLG